MITQIITSSIYDSAAANAKIISFEYNLYSDVLDEDGEPTYVGGFAVGPINSVHGATPEALADPNGSAYQASMSESVNAGAALKTDLTLTAVTSARTDVVAGVTRHTEYYRVDP